VLSSWGVAGAVGRPKMIFDALEVRSTSVTNPITWFLRGLIGLVAVTDGRDCSLKEGLSTAESTVRCARVDCDFVVEAELGIALDLFD
jgi:hypothetical protein